MPYSLEEIIESVEKKYPQESVNQIIRNCSDSGLYTIPVIQYIIGVTNAEMDQSIYNYQSSLITQFTGRATLVDCLAWSFDRSDKEYVTGVLEKVAGRFSIRLDAKKMIQNLGSTASDWRKIYIVISVVEYSIASSL